MGYYANDFEGGTLGAVVDIWGDPITLAGTYVAGRQGLGLSGPSEGGASSLVSYEPFVNPKITPRGVARVDFKYTDYVSSAAPDGSTVLSLYGVNPSDPGDFSLIINLRRFQFSPGVYNLYLGFGPGYDIANPVPFEVWMTARVDWTSTGFSFVLLDADGATMFSLPNQTYETVHRPSGANSRVSAGTQFVGGTVIDNFEFGSPGTVVRQYPRDDEYGLGSAPRLYPPPRRGRVVGGIQ